MVTSHLTYEILMYSVYFLTIEHTFILKADVIRKTLEIVLRYTADDM